ncbi:hypothetical protein [Haloarchaeobius amylolyticus]|uniref:hypothetical protein n=1 Tax=Haloarchaeobius amylolyticus TaxID=1198296 RepID=UPI00226E7274|nr:hypothetical protein [Haloarchaeobius amylolyticus]
MSLEADRTVVDELLGAFDAADARQKRVDLELLPLGDGTQVSRTFTATAEDGARYTTTGAAAVDAALTLEGARLEITETAETDQGRRLGYAPALRELDDRPPVRDSVSFRWVEDRFVREEVSLPTRRERPREFWYRWYDEDQPWPGADALAPAVRSVGERLFQVATARSTSNAAVTVSDDETTMQVTVPRPEGRSFTCDASVRNGELFLTGLAEQRHHDARAEQPAETAAGTAAETAELDAARSDGEARTRHEDVAVAVAPPYPITAEGARVTVTDDELVVRLPRCAPEDRCDGHVPVAWRWDCQRTV